jgi:hypothetical protein
MGLPNGWWPVQQTFGLDQYRTFQNPFRETWQQFFPNDTPGNVNWPVFIEGVAIPKNKVPPGMLSGVGDLLDIWPRTVWYGGPVTRYYAEGYRRIFEQWARAQGMAYDTEIIPVNPNAPWLPWPKSDFAWYTAYEVRPPKSYRLVRAFGQPNFRWVDVSFDTWKYKNFHRMNPTIT